MFKQITTGTYQYKTRGGEQVMRHSVYALDDQGQVWKAILNKGTNKMKWAKFEDLDVLKFEQAMTNYDKYC